MECFLLVVRSEESEARAGLADNNGKINVDEIVENHELGFPLGGTTWQSNKYEQLSHVILLRPSQSGSFSTFLRSHQYCERPELVMPSEHDKKTGLNVGNFYRLVKE
jgi:hypothetical protein